VEERDGEGGKGEGKEKAAPEQGRTEEGKSLAEGRKGRQKRASEGKKEIPLQHQNIQPWLVQPKL
jgi:hypothetical protein